MNLLDTYKKDVPQNVLKILNIKSLLIACWYDNKSLSSSVYTSFLAASPSFLVEIHWSSSIPLWKKLHRHSFVVNRQLETIMQNVSPIIPCIFLLFKASAFLQIFFLRKSKFWERQIFSIVKDIPLLINLFIFLIELEHPLKHQIQEHICKFEIDEITFWSRSLEQHDVNKIPLVLRL